MTAPLEGVRLVEIAGIGPAPFGVMLLADLGVEVIRVDRTVDTIDQQRMQGLSRGRRSIGVDLKQGPAASSSCGSSSRRTCWSSPSAPASPSASASVPSRAELVRPRAPLRPLPPQGRHRGRRRRRPRRLRTPRGRLVIVDLDEQPLCHHSPISTLTGRGTSGSGADRQPVRLHPGVRSGRLVWFLTSSP